MLQSIALTQPEFWTTPKLIIALSYLNYKDFYIIKLDFQPSKNLYDVYIIRRMFLKKNTSKCDDYLTITEPVSRESISGTLLPLKLRLLPMAVTLTSHRIMTVVSLSGVKSSTSMSVSSIGNVMVSWNRTRLPTFISVVSLYGYFFLRSNVTFPTTLVRA